MRERKEVETVRGVRVGGERQREKRGRDRVKGERRE